jgi:HPt (histidine-containing phosphotransfer) domain-containing protein
MEIAGVAIEAGLRNIGGSLTAYMDILEEFCRDAEERAPQLEEALTRGDLGLYRTLVHALKGAARGIGAAEFGDIAAEMEEKAKNGDYAGVQARNSHMLIVLRRLTEGIRVTVDQKMDGERKEVLSASQVEALRSALARDDIGVVNELLAEYTAIPLRPDVKAKLAAVERDILMFDYDQAAAKIDALKIYRSSV